MRRIIIYSAIILGASALSTNALADTGSPGHTHDQDEYSRYMTEGKNYQGEEQKAETATERRKRKRREVKARLRAAREHRRGNTPKHYH